MELIKKDLKKFQELLDILKKAIRSKEVVFLRYHNDCDGYTSAIALDNFLYSEFFKTFTKERDIFYYYKKFAQHTPFYSFDDALKDINYIHSSIVPKNKNPILILLDTGSGKNNIEGFKLLKNFGFKIIIIDHHPHSTDTQDNVDFYINPSKYSSHKISAGLLISQLLKLATDKDTKIYDTLSCISSISDKMEGEEFKQLIKDQNYDKLKESGEIIDYIIQQSNYQDPMILIKEILFNNLDKKDIFLTQFRYELDSKNKQAIDTASRYSTIKKKKDKTISILEKDKIAFKDVYPNAIKSFGLLHNHLKTIYPKDEIISLGFSSNSVSLRATDNSKVDLNDLLKKVQVKFPESKADGGGHAHAGTIRFVEAASEKIKEFILDNI